MSRVERVQGLRRSGAAGPHSFGQVRSAVNRAAIEDQLQEVTNMLDVSEVLDQLMKIAVKARDENGGEDYHYPRDEDGCMYVRGGKADCIVGRWLHEYKGVALSTLAEYELTGASEVVPKVLYLDPMLPDPAIEALGMVQQLQDRGWGWIKAVTTAREAPRLRGSGGQTIAVSG